MFYDFFLQGMHISFILTCSTFQLHVFCGGKNVACGIKLWLQLKIQQVLLRLVLI